MIDFNHAAIDEILHSRVRLAIVAFLAGARTADFTAVRDATKTTDGNAGIHLRKLEDSGYVEMTKQFVGRRPQTTCRLTAAGRRRFLDYLSVLETVVADAAATARADAAPRRGLVKGFAPA